MSANASTMEAGSMPGPNYVLKDELAQLSLAKSDYDPNRKVAWTNTLCVCVLVVGLIGIQTPAALVLRLQKEEPQIVEVNEKPVPVQQVLQQEERRDDEPEEEQPEQPALPTVVALNTSAVQFALPVDGPVTVTANAAVATPPPRVIDRPPPQNTGPKAPTTILFRGGKKGGDEGYVPDMPPDRLGRDLLKKINDQRIDQVRVELSWTVDASGNISNVKVEKGSQLPDFDRLLAAWIKEKGSFPATGSEVNYRWPYRVSFN